MGLFSFLHPSKQPKHTLKPEKEARLLVVPVDDSQHSLQALEWAVNNIYRADRADEVHLLSVVPRVAGPYPAEVSLHYRLQHCQTGTVYCALSTTSTSRIQQQLAQPTSCSSLVCGPTNN